MAAGLKYTFTSAATRGRKLGIGGGHEGATVFEISMRGRSRDMHVVCSCWKQRLLVRLDINSVCVSKSLYCKDGLVLPADFTVYPKDGLVVISVSCVALFPRTCSPAHGFAVLSFMSHFLILFYDCAYFFSLTVVLLFCHCRSGDMSFFVNATFPP